MTTPKTSLDRAAAPEGVVRAVIEIAATPEDVFAALTNPRELAAWLGGVDDYSPAEWNDDPTVGASWRSPAIGPDGAHGAVRGELLVVDAPRRLVSTWHASWDHYARSIVRYELEPAQVDGIAGTRLTVIHSAPAARMQHTSQFGATRDGWTLMLARLARLMNERLTV
jgi:uncharacterized protein YndB with AHSA1/START domain